MRILGAIQFWRVFILFCGCRVIKEKEKEKKKRNIFIHRSILYIAGPKINSDIHRYSPEDNIFDFQQIV